MALKYDPEANALYVKLDNKNKVKKTLTLGDGVYLDVDEKDKPVGVEVILPKKKESKDVTKALNELAVVRKHT